MKVGVIADIHSNQTAFRACVDHMVNAGCEEFLLLGDLISEYRRCTAADDGASL